MPLHSSETAWILLFKEFIQGPCNGLLTWKASGAPVLASRASTMFAEPWPMLSSKKIWMVSSSLGSSSSSFPARLRSLRDFQKE